MRGNLHWLAKAWGIPGWWALPLVVNSCEISIVHVIQPVISQRCFLLIMSVHTAKVAYTVQLRKKGLHG